jgi:hypothetical protein
MFHEVAFHEMSFFKIPQGVVPRDVVPRAVVPRDTVDPVKCAVAHPKRTLFRVETYCANKMGKKV